eukprot:1159493-Pelagomonas_calceolata.AAC.4
MAHCVTRMGCLSQIPHNTVSWKVHTAGQVWPAHFRSYTGLYHVSIIGAFCVTNMGCTVQVPHNTLSWMLHTV